MPSQWDEGNTASQDGGLQSPGSMAGCSNAACEACNSAAEAFFQMASPKPRWTAADADAAMAALLVSGRCRYRYAASAVSKSPQQLGLRSAAS